MRFPFEPGGSSAAPLSSSPFLFQFGSNFIYIQYDGVYACVRALCMCRAHNKCECACLHVIEIRNEEYIRRRVNEIGADTIQYYVPIGNKLFKFLSFDECWKPFFFISYFILLLFFFFDEFHHHKGYSHLCDASCPCSPASEKNSQTHDFFPSISLNQAFEPPSRRNWKGR